MDTGQLWEERLATPVLLAALASVPATFLTLLDDPYATAGIVVNYVSGAVLVAETAVLLTVSNKKLQWLRDNWLLVVLTLVVIAGVVLAVGPLQVLRLLRVFGALRIVRTGRIIKAVRLLRDNDGVNSFWAHIGSLALAGLAIVFVGVVLADPSSTARQLIDTWVSPAVAVILIVLAGLILGIATFIVAVAKRDDRNGHTGM